MLLANSVSLAFECPDEAALNLYRLAGDSNAGLAADKGMATLKRIIESATRRMDEPALHRACRRLTFELFNDVTHCDLRDCRPGLVWPDGELERQVSMHPILSRCPDHAISFTSRLPTVRHRLVPTEKLIRKTITGAVEFRIVVAKDGSVESARILQSSYPELNEVAIETIMKFKYQPKLDSERQPVRTEDVAATIVIDYFNLAWASGCRRPEDVYP